MYDYMEEDDEKNLPEYLTVKYWSVSPRYGAYLQVNLRWVKF